MRALAWLLLFTACARTQAPEPQSAPPRASPGWRELAELESERALGRRIDSRIGSRLGFYGERRAASYLESVGRAVARSATRREPSFVFRIVDHETVNAFAVPGGYIYVTRGLLAELASEAELAAILAHEIAHVDRRHSLREHAWEDDRDPAWTRADLLRFYDRSRDNEREADFVAVGSLASAGYAPWALGSALRRLERVECGDDDDEPDDPLASLSTHPAMPARIARALAAAHVRSVRSGRVGRARHLGAIDGMAFGSNPRRGYLARGRWVLPTARLAFELPARWKASASSSSLFAAPDDGSGFLLLLRAEGDLETKSPEGEARTIEVAGRAARQTLFEVDAQHSGSFARIELDSEVLLMIATLPRGSSAELAALAQRFERVNDPALLHPRSRRLVVRKLGRATTLARLAQGAPVSLETLARLNGLSENTALRAGATVKLVR